MVKVLIYIQMLFIVSTQVLIRHLWQPKTVVFLHWCVIYAVLLINFVHCQSEIILNKTEIVILVLVKVSFKTVIGKRYFVNIHPVNINEHNGAKSI